MKKLLFASLVAATFFAACKGGDNAGTAGTTAAATPTAPAAPTVKKGTIDGKVPADVAAQLLIKFDDRIKYGGTYEYYEKDGKQVLHGKYEIKTNESSGDFVSRYSDPNSDEHNYELLWDFEDVHYAGQCVDGVQDGKMTFKLSYHEAGGEGYILYDAKTKSCTEGKYEGGAESMCFAYTGKLPNCRIGDFSDLNKEVPCE